MPGHQVVAVIMGGGAGTRLYPLTRERAKPAVPLGGKYRLIDIPISNCLNSGINQMFVLTQYLSVSLNRHISWTYNNMGLFSGGWVQILAAEQALGVPAEESWYQGTADAVRKQLNELETVGAETILILAGDHLYRMDYQDFIRRHYETNADVTIAVQPVAAQEAPRLGILAVNDQGEVTDFEEKQSDLAVIEAFKSGDDPEKPFLASMGIYVFRRRVLTELLNTVSESDFGHHIIPEAIRRYRVAAFTFDGYWADIGTIRAFYDVNLLLAQPDQPFSFYDQAHPIYTHPRFLPPTRSDDCHLEQVLVSEGCKLNKAMIRESVIGVRSAIGPDTRIVRTLMMGSDYYDNDQRCDPGGRCHDIPLGIGSGCNIEGAILDKNVRIGKNVVIRPHAPDENGIFPPGSSPGRELYVVRDGIVVVPKNTEIADGTVI
ncbi:MAG: glucose-1-phosphate adenylyltransferase [Anaerolineae bacterium]|nr:glucose-1-phosphate adenylyltransferase [Anaerolineae bacterium]